jgi:hypothetical protein
MKKNKLREDNFAAVAKLSEDLLQSLVKARTQLAEFFLKT